MKILSIPGSVELPSEWVGKVVASILMYLDNLVRPFPVRLEFSDIFQYVSSAYDQVSNLNVSMLDMLNQEPLEFIPSSAPAPPTISISQLGA